MKTNYQKLKEIDSELVKEYSEMNKEQLLESICAEVLDLYHATDRVQLFMNECTDNMSKTNYTLESIMTLINNKKEKDLSEFCKEVLEENNNYDDLKNDLSNHII